MEKLKLKKDPTAAFTDLYEYAAAIRAGTLDYARRRRPVASFEKGAFSFRARG